MKALSGLKLSDLQPSQFWISEGKLEDVRAWFDPEDLSNFEPIPVKMLDGRPVMTDGHTRAAAAVMAGLESVPLCAEEDELDWELYRACVEECAKRGVMSPVQLAARVIPEEEYRVKWDGWCDELHESIAGAGLTVRRYTRAEIPDVLAFERALRDEEDGWGWEIDEAYEKSVRESFNDARFTNSLSYLAYRRGRVIGRIDAALIPSHFDGSVKAYLDWICVLKSCRHRGAAQKLMAALREELARRGVDTLIALTASNEEAQRFYKSVPDSLMRDTGIWIDIK
ncbi:MAG: GNAT family N-acetyltransferase [Clostridia bacterium]|nr:GNAT family N-acetyltransferase [Clostridia bacterium]